MKYPLLATLVGTLAILVAGCSTVQEAASVEVQSPQVSGNDVGRRTSFAFVPHLNREAAAAFPMRRFGRTVLRQPLPPFWSKRSIESLRRYEKLTYWSHFMWS